MDKRHRYILTHHRPYLLENLQPIKLLPYLSILDESDRQEVRQERTTVQQIETLLDMLSRKGPDAFGEFINALERKQMFIALHLKQETEMEDIRKDLARVTEEREELKEKCENLEKQLQEAKAYMERQLAANQFQDRATSPVEPTQCEIKDLADKSCSRCAKMGEDLNLIRSEKEKLKKDVLEINNNIKEFSEYRKQESQKVRQDLENLKKYLQESNELVTKKTEDQVQEITTLRKENQELRDETVQKRYKINKLNAKLTTKDEALKKAQEELEKLKGNWKRCAREKKKAMEENEKLNKKLNKQDECYSHCEKLKEELNLIKTEKENLEKEVGKLSKDYQRALQTSSQKERESHSRCEKLQRTLNVITGERDSMREQKQNLDKEVVNLNNRIKEISEDYQRTKKELQQILKEERENVSRELVAANEQRKEEKNVLQGKNEEPKDQIKRQTFHVRKNTVQPTREKTHIEKKQKEGQPKQKWVSNPNPRKQGVVYAFATDFGNRKTWEKGASTPIIATRSSDYRGKAEDLLDKDGTLSGTRDEENSWWREDLPAKYVLNLRTTPYSEVGTIKSHTSSTGALRARLVRISGKR